MFCSEYAAKITVLALDRLNENLMEKMQQSGKEVSGQTILTMPINKHEDLSKVDPARLINQLKIRKAVEEVENSLVKSAVRRG